MIVQHSYYQRILPIYRKLSQFSWEYLQIRAYLFFFAGKIVHNPKCNFLKIGIILSPKFRLSISKFKNNSIFKKIFQFLNSKIFDNSQSTTLQWMMSWLKFNLSYSISNARNTNIFYAILTKQPIKLSLQRWLIWWKFKYILKKKKTGKNEILSCERR